MRETLTFHPYPAEKPPKTECYYACWLNNGMIMTLHYSEKYRLFNTHAESDPDEQSLTYLDNCTVGWAEL